MAEVRGKMMEQAAEAVTGGQEQCKADGATSGEAPEAAPAPKTAGAPALPHHRRSKSASSGRNLEACDHGGAGSHGVVEQRFHRPPQQNPPDPRKSSHATEGSPVHRGMPRDHRASTSSPNHRVSLENDVSKEKALSSVSFYFSVCVNWCLEIRIAGLWQVSQLQLHLHQERSIRIMLDRAIGRASSTLSPGHRHFPAQTKELIAEIELLEEEIANREQHVLTLYRSIFDQCVSGPSSGQSSGISSPAHAKSLPYSGSSSLARTLKDHLYQCPSKISEEMVRCMASIYCLLRAESQEKAERARSPFLSRSSTSVILPRRGNGEETIASNNKSIVEVCSISVEKNQMPDVSVAITHYRLLVEQLERVDLSMSGTSIKLAFWINVYNSLVMHWFESILSTAMRKRCADEKQLVQLKFGLPDCQPLVLFALCTGASSDPMLKVYTAKNVADELERAKREFLQASVVVRKSRKVFLPRLVERYAKEAGLPVGDGILAWARDNVDGRAAQDAIQRCAAAAAGGGRRRASQAFEWLPYNARFRYAFARSMVDKQAAAVLA
ncbi:hypothetical protein ACQ4PT_033224 [Festuca glaucescens]